MMWLANDRIRGLCGAWQQRRSPSPSPVSATAAAPSPNRLFTTAVRMVESNTYAAEHASAHSRIASWPGWAADQAAVTPSAFSPALQPMPTTSTRLHCGAMPISRISRALRPGVRKPVVVTQHR